MVSEVICNDDNHSLAGITSAVTVPCMWKSKFKQEASGSTVLNIGTVSDMSSVSLLYFFPGQPVPFLCSIIKMCAKNVRTVELGKWIFLRVYLTDFVIQNISSFFQRLPSTARWKFQRWIPSSVAPQADYTSVPITSVKQRTFSFKHYVS